MYYTQMYINLLPDWAMGEATSENSGGQVKAAREARVSSRCCHTRRHRHGILATQCDGRTVSDTSVIEPCTILIQLSSSELCRLARSGPLCPEASRSCKRNNAPPSYESFDSYLLPPTLPQRPQNMDNSPAFVRRFSDLGAEATRRRYFDILRTTLAPENELARIQIQGLGPHYGSVKAPQV